MKKKGGIKIMPKLYLVWILFLYRSDEENLSMQAYPYSEHYYIMRRSELQTAVEVLEFIDVSGY